MDARGNPARLREVELLVLDVDGVLTDGGLYYGHDGEAMKRFDVMDGHGIVLCRKLGLPSAILTARTSGIVAARAAELGIAHVLQGEHDKPAGFEKLLALTGVPAERIAYIGDDVNDLGVLARVGFSACPADAHPDVRSRVDYVCRAPGGHGAVRELCELWLEARGKRAEVMPLVGAPVAVAPATPAPPTTPAAPTAPATPALPPVPYAPPPQNNLAVASLVLGILSLTCFGPFTGIPAIICGSMALKRKQPAALAMTGLVTGAITTAATILLVGMALIVAAMEGGGY